MSPKAEDNKAIVGRFVELAKGNLSVKDELLTSTSSIAAWLPDKVRPVFSGTLVERLVAGQPLDVLTAGDEEETVARLVRDGGLRAIDVGPLERARQLEGLGFLGMTTLQQPLGLNFQSAWKLIS